MPTVPASLAEPGLKVPATAWKWPRQWPYATDGLTAAGGPESKATAILDASALQKLHAHLVRHVPSGAAKVLEVDGAGAGLSVVPTTGGDEFWAKPKETVMVSAQQWADFGNTLPYDDESFDAIVLAHAAEVATDPRPLFRDVWRVLKPGGRAIVAFSSAKCSSDDHAARSVKMWKDYNDAQRLYIVGSYFHFSAGAPAAVFNEDSVNQAWGAGWRSLRGYDYMNAAEQGDGLLDKMQGAKTDGTPLFVVQADKPVNVRPGDGPAAHMDAQLWAARDMEEDDKRLCATRLLSLIDERDLDPITQETVAERAAANLPALYETLAPMGTVIATPLLAQLAANLAPGWNADDGDQRKALREGLGLDTPRAEFWQPLGTATAALSVDDKLWLLCDILPLFDSRRFLTVPVAGAEDGYKLPLAVSTLLVEEGPLRGALRHVASAMVDAATEREQQLLAVDLVARDFLPDAVRATDKAALDDANDKFLTWVRGLSKFELQSFLDERQNYLDAASEEAKLARLDPEAAAKKADELRRAAAVEDMLNDIAVRVDAKKTAQRDSSLFAKLPFFNKK